MPPLLHYDPSGATFSPIPAGEYQKLLEAMKDDARVSKLVENPDNTGSCEVQGVDFVWLYDGTNSLHVTITSKHGFVMSRIPNATIFDELNEKFVSKLA